MSVQALTCAIAIRGVSSSEKLLLMVLANYANEKMQCWPSHRKLADDACLSERTILTLMKALEVRRIISRRERRREDGSRGTDVITMHFSGEVISPRGETASPYGEIDGGGVGKPLRGGGEVVSPLTTFEPSTEPSEEEPLEAPQATPPAKRRSRLVPDAWAPSAKVFNDLCVEGFTPGEIERELANFRDHEFPDPKSDFDRAFRKWVRRSRTFNRAPHERPDPRTAKLHAKQANYASAWEGSERAAGLDWKP